MLKILFILFGVCIVLIINFQLIDSENVTQKQLNASVEADTLIGKDELQNFTTYVNNLLRGTLGPLDLITPKEISPKCRLDSAEYLRQLQNLTFWALKMYDASAKIPSGLLNGNINQFGDFDQCVNTRSDDQNISGQYCLTNFQIDEPNSRYLFKLNTLINAHFPFRNELDDPGHIAARVLNINWAVCIPSSCTHQDVEAALKNTFESFIHQTGISIRIKVFEELCQTNQRPIATSTILVGLFFASIIGFTLIISAIDYFFMNPSEDLCGIQGILFAFSLCRTFKTLCSLKRAKDDLESVHGIRFVNVCMILFVHKTLVAFYTPYTNRVDMADVVAQPYSTLSRAASIYTDTFLMLSGMLSAYSFFGRINRGKRISIIEEYISRLIRIVPCYAAIILFCGFVQPWLGSGPQWNIVVTHNSKLCSNYWWRNLLFIQNYFGSENMCVPQSHQIGTDTQLFFVSPLFFWILLKQQKRGVMFLLVLAALSTFLRFHDTHAKGLTLLFHYGATLQQLYKSANNLYILPTHRATVYIIGIILGYYLRNIKAMKLKPAILNVGHATAIALFCLTFVQPAFSGDRFYKYDSTRAAWYSAFAPITWCLTLAWIIFTEHYGYTNMFTRVLSWRGWLISTRLSYAVYLVQLPIYFQNAGTVRSSEYFELIKTVFNIHEFLVIIFSSIILTLLFDTPFERIKKICLNKYENRTNLQKLDLQGNNITNSNDKKTS